MRRVSLVVAVLLPLVGCSQSSPSSEVAAEPLEAENGLTSNGLTSNGLTSNGLTSNGLTSNGLTSNGLVTNAYVLSALRDQTATGQLSRLVFRYLVNCALPTGKMVTYTWTDSASVVHTEQDPGSLGLAPTWETSPASQADKEIVSACLGARTNSLGVSVPISMRANGISSLAVSTAERSQYTYGEGSFWGNVFDPSPYLYSCSRAAYGAGIASSQYTSKGRTCAAGNCGLIKYVGRCLSSDHSTNGQACYDRDKAFNDWSTDCFPSMFKAPTGGASNVITTWLMP
jgi:hypothetical protein